MFRSLKDEFGRDLWQCKERKRICTSWKLWLINGILPGGDTADSETLPVSQRPSCQRQMAAGKVTFKYSVNEGSGSVILER